MQHDVPATPLDAIDNAIENGHVGRAAEMFDEIETHAPYSAAIQCVEFLVGEAIVHDSHTAIAFRVRCDAIKHGSIVGAVTACLHDHSTFDTQVGMQCGQHFLRSVCRCVTPVRRVRKLRGGAKNVAMGVTGRGRQLKARLAAMVEKRGVDVHGLPLAKWS